MGKKLDIEAKSLTKRFKARTAVDGLTLDIAHGELFSLLGVNGAGKSTTIRMLSCLTKPTSGDALVLGHSVLHDPELVKKAISVSPQETAVAPNLTTAENLAFAYAIYGHSRKESRTRAEEYLDKLQMRPIEKQPARTLSGGWQRRLSIAMALISEPKVLFLDEPTLGLDVLARRELWQLIRGLKGQVTIILTTHYLEEAEALSDRIGIMSAGKLCAVGSAQELMDQTSSVSFEEAFVALCGEKKEAV